MLTHETSGLNEKPVLFWEEQMIDRVTIKLAIILAALGMAFPSTGEGGERKFTATLFPSETKPIFMDDFDIEGEHFYDALKDGKHVKLPFTDIRSIKFLKPGKSELKDKRFQYDVEITFNDGKKGNYVLRPAGSIVIKSNYATVTMSHSKLAKIEFNTSPPPKRKTKRKKQKFDRVFLKNGDNLSGKVQTEIFKVHTPYGSYELNPAQISYIDFEARGGNVDVIGLRIGDVLSGVVEVDSIKLLTRSGNEVTFQRDKIQRITF
jgi:hypothetical protein